MSTTYVTIRAIPPPISVLDEGKSVSECSYKEDPNLPPGFRYTTGHPFNGPSFRYFEAVGNPMLPNILYSHSELVNDGPGPSVCDKDQNIAINKEKVLTALGGYCSSRANVVIAAGEWYYEVEIKKSNEEGNEAHVRVGLSRRELPLYIPVGSDAYSYAVGDRGQKVHAARPKEFMEPFTTGDVIGFHVFIPRTFPHKTPYLVSREIHPIRYNGQLFLEYSDYVPTKRMGKLLLPKEGIDIDPKEGEFIPGSFIKVYKNGEYKGILAENLREFLPPHSEYKKETHLLNQSYGLSGYYPTISLYRGGQARFRFGPDFLGKKPESARPVSEIYDEQISDSIVFDLVNQVHYGITDPFDLNKVQGSLLVIQDNGKGKIVKTKEQSRAVDPDAKRPKMAPGNGSRGSTPGVKSEKKGKNAKR